MLSKLNTLELVESAAGLPYLRLVLPAVPYYVFVGSPKAKVEAPQ